MCFCDYSEGLFVDLRDRFLAALFGFGERRNGFEDGEDGLGKLAIFEIKNVMFFGAFVGSAATSVLHKIGNFW